ncbi:MAG: PQQ-binding-like beta-propeller repeat protein [Candidatus Ratteibacteria bacterium]
MKKFLFIYLFSSFLLFSSSWYERNKELLVVFSSDVWKYIEKANYYSERGDFKNADFYLRKAKEKTENCEPFLPSNWPSGWPRNKESLKYLKYASPTAFIYRIIGDFCFDRGYTKEAIRFFEMYINTSLIPETNYYVLLADIYEKEGMYNQALNLYNALKKFIETKNYWGKEYSAEFLEKKIKNINFILKKNRVIVLSPLYIEIPSFIQSDFFDIFLNEVKNIKNIDIIQRENFEKVLKEQGFIEKDIEDEELKTAGKILNADYILKPSLTQISKTYILNVDVFSVNKGNWFENYEYKTDDARYILNLVKRFTFNFQGLDVPFQLYLPETKFLWSFEADSLINDLKISKDGKKIFIGCDSGSVYLLNEKGRIIKSLRMPEKVVKISISPDGNYFSFFTLEGKLYFGSANGKILWSKKTGNLGRGIAISENGKFIVAGIDKAVFYIDKNGEIFWEINLNDLISSLNITENGELVFIGTEKGEILCYKDDGNLKWNKNVKEKIIDIKSGGNFLCVETENGKIYLFDLEGNEIKNFKFDDEIEFNIFNPEILDLISGKKKNYLYFLSYDKKSLWKYALKEKVSFISSIPDGKFVVSAEGKNIFTFSIVWK